MTRSSVETFFEVGSCRLCEISVFFLLQNQCRSVFSDQDNMTDGGVHLAVPSCKVRPRYYSLHWKHTVIKNGALDSSVDYTHTHTQDAIVAKSEQIFLIIPFCIHFFLAFMYS